MGKMPMPRRRTDNGEIDLLRAMARREERMRSQIVTASKRHPAAIDPVIRTLRGERAMLDAGLARIHGVETKSLPRALKRKVAKFPANTFSNLPPQNTTL